MRVTVWGSRGSIASAGPQTLRYGGDTACLTVEDGSDVVIVLDAGTGLRRAGNAIAGDGRLVHLLLTHLHMDHIQGLGFFRPLFEPGREIHIWGPPSAAENLRARLTRYLSPPLFPVRIRDLPSSVELHDVPSAWAIGAFGATATTVIHPGPTVGYRLVAAGRTVAYLPDHEPALGGRLNDPDWTSGYDLASGADLLIHDAQYTSAEYEQRVGWGHSSVEHAASLADLAGAGRLVLFHHEPDHDDETIDRMVDEAMSRRLRGDAVGAREGMTIDL